jgi:capsular exopolysaccharide synthesis family protein
MDPVGAVDREGWERTLTSDAAPDARSVPTVSPFELLAVVWRRKLIVGLVLILAVGAAVVLSKQATKQYSSSAQLLFRDPGFVGALFKSSNLFQGGADPKRDLQTEIDVVHSTNVAVEAKHILHTNATTSDLLGSVNIQPSTDSDVVTVKATDTSPTRAAAIANAFATGYVTYRRNTDRAAVADAEKQLSDSLATATPAEKPALQDSLQQLRQLQALQTGNAEVIAQAQPNGKPVSPTPQKNAILAGLLGLLLGAGLALLVEFLDKRLKSVEDFERAYRGYPVIAAVPRTAVSDPLATELSGPAGEAYRMLREGLRFLDPNGLARCFVVASAEESEGKSTVAVHLAKSLSAVGQRVILIEADMRRPTAAAALGVDPDTAGLSNLLVSDNFLDEYLVDVFGDGTLKVLPSGTVPPSPADLLRAGRMPDVVSSAREAADVVIIDPPPLLPVSDTRVVLQLDEIDGVIVVGRVGITRRDRAREAQRVLDQSGRRVFGLVITGAAAFGHSSYYDQLPGAPDRSRKRRRAQEAPTNGRGGRGQRTRI